LRTRPPGFRGISCPERLITEGMDPDDLFTEITNQV
jgi:hypothetical protein